MPLNFEELLQWYVDKEWLQRIKKTQCFQSTLYMYVCGIDWYT